MQFHFRTGANVKKAAASIATLAAKDRLRPHNFLWQDKAQFEHEVSLLQRFLVDAPISGGAHNLSPCQVLTTLAIETVCKVIPKPELASSTKASARPSVKGICVYILCNKMAVQEPGCMYHLKWMLKLASHRYLLQSAILSVTLRSLHHGDSCNA